MFFEFGAPVSAIAFNDNTVSIQRATRGRRRRSADRHCSNRLRPRTASRRDEDWSAGMKPDFAVVRQPGPNFILLRGTFPLGHAPATLDLAMIEPANDGRTRPEATARSARSPRHRLRARAACASS